MNIQLGNLELKDVVEKEYLQKIQEFLDTNGYKRENTCNNIENELGNYHIFDIPRQIVICGREKIEDLINSIIDLAVSKEREKNVEIVKAATPQHITREYRDTDKMRDDIISLINTK